MEQSASREAVELFERALSDPALHRRLPKRHIKPAPLKDWQAQCVRAVESLIYDGTGDTMTFRVCRQAGKNEIAGTVHERFLLRHCGIGGSMVRGAPTWKPQIVNSKRRLKEIAARDPLFEYRALSWVEGYIAEYGQAEIHFLSTDDQANTEGATASCLLDIDEAHRTSEDSYDEKFKPMTASTNAPTVMYGVAASKNDILYKERKANFETGKGHRNIQITAPQLAEIDPVYRAHYEGRVARLGASHPVILTQYDMVDVEALGGAFKPEHIKSLCDSTHQRIVEPRPLTGQDIVVVIDLAGEEEEKTDFDEDFSESYVPDAVVVLVVAVDRRNRVMDKPLCRILDIKRWTGMKFQAIKDNEEWGIQEHIMATLAEWNPKTTLIDSRGLGAPIASWVSRVWHGEVIKYAATLTHTSADIYETYAFLNLGQLQLFRDDGSDEYKQFVREMGWARIKFTGDMVNLKKPGRVQKIDLAKALTYVPRAVESVASKSAWGWSDRI